MGNKTKVNILSRKRVYDSFFKIEEAILTHEQTDGSQSQPMTRFSFERGDSVAALVYHTEKQQFLFTKQFRYPVYHKSTGWVLEVVAGSMESNEEPEDALIREMEEELGYSTNDLKHLHTFFASPGGSSERIFLYFCEVSEKNKVSDGGGVTDEQEDIELVFLPVQEIIQMMENNAIEDAKTLVALYWAKSFMEQFQ